MRKGSFGAIALFAHLVDACGNDIRVLLRVSFGDSNPDGQVPGVDALWGQYLMETERIIANLRKNPILWGQLSDYMGMRRYSASKEKLTPMLVSSTKSPD